MKVLNPLTLGLIYGPLTHLNQKGILNVTLKKTN